MASIDYQNSLLWRGEDPLKRKNNPLLDKTKRVERYRPGQVPKWAQDEEAQKKRKKTDEDEVDKLEGFSSRSIRRSPPGGKDKKEKEPERRRRRDRAPVAAVVLEAGNQEDAASSRLKRLRASAETVPADPSDRLVRHRVIHEARVVEAAAEKEKDEEEEKLMVLKKEEQEEVEEKVAVAELQLPMYDDISGDEAEDNELRTLRRERAREAALEKRKAEEEVLKEELGDEEEESSEEDSDDSEDDDPRRSALLKPVFVSKTQRETVREKEAQQKEEEAARLREEERKTEKKAESKTLLVDQIKHDNEVEAAAALNNDDDKSDIELIDDNDEVNEAEEYELWKIRELKRIKRDKEERLARQQEMELIERRRRMTDAEREEDDKRMDAKSTKREETKNFTFLQKYYHRGTFFQDKAVTGEEPLYNRDYHEPTAEETFDKSMLPKAMQLRRGQFGKKGQVKHTHLTDVDTTDQTAAWSQQTKVMEKYQTKMAAAKSINVFDRESMSASSRAPG